jgi:leader peptidase (prepilin peptidase)/N-methyltransferase
LEKGVVVSSEFLAGAPGTLSSGLEMNPAAAGAVTLSATALLALVALVSARACGIVNILTMPVAFVVVLTAGVLGAALAAAIPFGCSAAILLSIAFINGTTDLRSGFCFDTVQLCAASALLVNRYASLSDALSGLLVGIALLGVPYMLTWGKGIGLGDVKFAAAIGLGLGASGETQAIYTAFVSGGTAAVCLLLSGRAHRKAPIAFAPFLSFGTVCALIASPSS